MALVERLVHLGSIEKDGKPTGEIDDLLLADLMDRVVLGLHRHDQRGWVYHSIILREWIRHSLQVVIEHLRKDLIQPCVLLSRQPQTLDERRWCVGVDSFLRCREVKVERCIASVGHLCSVDVVHD